MPDLRVVRAFEVWVIRVHAPRLLSIFKVIVSALVAIPLVQAKRAVADHVPDSLSQDVDPNYIACLMAVDGASSQFLGALQTTCLTKMVQICGGRNYDAPQAQIIDCISFETHRGVDFLEAAVDELPETIEKTGFFERRYMKGRESIKGDIKTAKAFPKPGSIEVAIQQSLPMVASAIMLFYLARETGTPLETLVEATSKEH